VLVQPDLAASAPARHHRQFVATNKKVKASEQQSPRRSGSLACLVAEAYERGGEEKDATATPGAVTCPGGSLLVHG